MNSPFISIFIPVYNGAQYLKETLDSISAQQFTNFEVLCVDDSSTDNSYAILQNYASKDIRFRVFRKENEGSVPPSWRYVIPHLKGEFTLYMSQDDLLEPNSLILLAEDQAKADADAVVPSEYIYFENGTGTDRPFIGKRDLIGKVIDGTAAFRLMLDYSISGFTLWKTDIIRANGIRTDTFNTDELAQRQWISCCNRVAFSRAVFYYRCDNLQSITKQLYPFTYGSVYTNALLLQLANQVCPSDKKLQESLANNYFLVLYYRMIQYLQHQKDYTVAEKKTIRKHFRKAHNILRHQVTLPNWKYYIGRICYPMMELVTLFKYFQYRQRGILLHDDIDIPIQSATPKLI